MKSLVIFCFTFVIIGLNFVNGKHVGISTRSVQIQNVTTENKATLQINVETPTDKSKNGTESTDGSASQVQNSSTATGSPKAVESRNRSLPPCCKKLNSNDANRGLDTVHFIRASPPPWPTPQ